MVIGQRKQLPSLVELQLYLGGVQLVQPEHLATAHVHTALREDAETTLGGAGDKLTEK